ncbi:helix-turn-helix domain-containing protein, partial [Streptomyces sp. 2MCAF27]
MEGVRTAREIGAELRAARARAGLTQRQVGKIIGYSASAVSRIEAGKLRLEYDRLLAFAAVLHIAPDRLIGTPVPGGAVLGTVGRPADEEDAVRRRNLLNGALAAGTAVVFGAPPAAAAPDAGDPAAPLE